MKPAKRGQTEPGLVALYDIWSGNGAGARAISAPYGLRGCENSLTTLVKVVL